MFFLLFVINSNPFFSMRSKIVEDFRFGIPKSCMPKIKHDKYGNIISRSYQNLRLFLCIFGLCIALHNPQISQNEDGFDYCSLLSHEV